MSKGEIASVRVLMFHRILHRGSKSGRHSLSLEEFTRRLDWLVHFGYSPITFMDLQQAENHRLDLPEKPILLTFDDGFKDFYDRALPELMKRGMRAVIFALGDPSVRTSFWDRDTGFGVHPLMNGSDLRELRSYGFEIGSHTLSHADLAQIPIDLARKEITLSKDRLQQTLGEQVMSFSYPFGNLNASIKMLVGESGYRFACAAYSGPRQFLQDPMEIWRVGVDGLISDVGFLMRLTNSWLNALSMYSRYVKPVRARIRERLDGNTIGKAHNPHLGLSTSD